MTAVPPFSHSRAGELTLGTALGLLAAFPAGSTACVDGDLTERCVQGEGSWRPLVASSKTPRNLAGSSFPALLSYKTGRDDQQQRCPLTAQSS